MPHPEAFVHYTQHPRWTREVHGVEGDWPEDILKTHTNTFLEN